MRGNRVNKSADLLMFTIFHNHLDPTTVSMYFCKVFVRRRYIRIENELIRLCIDINWIVSLLVWILRIAPLLPALDSWNIPRAVQTHVYWGPKICDCIYYIILFLLIIYVFHHVHVLLVDRYLRGYRSLLNCQCIYKSLLFWQYICRSLSFWQYFYNIP